MPVKFGHMTGLVAVAALLAAAMDSHGEDWPQWRGADRASISREEGWFDKWYPERLWATEAGLGYSSVAVSSNRLYVAGYLGFGDEMGEDTVYCLDASSGTNIWSYTFPAAGPGYAMWPGARATPIVHGTNVYMHNRDGEVLCLNALSGAKVWRNTTSSSGKPAYGGYAGSPVVEGELLLLQSGEYGCALYADSGTEAWNNPAASDRVSAWSSPVVTDWNGLRVALLQTKTRLYAVNALTGAYVGYHPCVNVQKCADPIVWGNNVFISASDDGLADDPVYPSDGPVSRLVSITNGYMSAVWSGGDLTAECNTPVLIDDYLYGTSYADGEYLLMCVDIRTGKAVWTQDMDSVLAPIDTEESGEMMLTSADGYLFIVSGARPLNSGRLIVVRATPDGYDDGGREPFEIMENAGRHDWYGQPVLADGRLYLRSSGYEEEEGSGSWLPGKVVCLGFSGTPTDLDGDGMADTWESEVLGSVTNRPHEDSDGDGSSNLDEYLAGTDGLDPNEAARITLDLCDGAPVLTCATRSVEGTGYDEGLSRRYTLESRTNLLEGTWEPVAGFTDRVGNGADIVHTNEAPDTAGFFRVRVSLP